MLYWEIIVVYSEIYKKTCKYNMGRIQNIWILNLVVHIVTLRLEKATHQVHWLDTSVNSLNTQTYWFWFLRQVYEMHNIYTVAQYLKM
jgi:hypothetical protein